MSSKKHGIIPAVLTPYDSEGALSPAKLEELADDLIERGAQGLFVCGTTGEFPFLTVAEREQIAATSIATAAGRVPVVVHVGCLHMSDTVHLAKHAKAAGAAALSSVPPFYYDYTEEAILDHLGEVATATDLPFYFYHIPPRTHVTPDVALFERIAKVPNVVGCKYSSGDLDLLQRLIQVLGPDFTFFCGGDENLLKELDLGVGGAVGSTYNFLLPYSNSIWSEYQDGNREASSTAQDTVNRFVTIATMYSNIAVTKEIMRLRGLDLGPPRRPQSRLTPQQCTEIAEGLEREGYWSLPGVGERAVK